MTYRKILSLQCVCNQFAKYGFAAIATFVPNLQTYACIHACKSGKSIQTWNLVYALQYICKYGNLTFRPVKGSKKTKLLILEVFIKKKGLCLRH